MKRAVLVSTCGLLVVAFGLVAVGWVIWRSELKRLSAPQSITDETGLLLPTDARITGTRADVFSLADRDNFEWLIESNSSLIPWARANMKPEGGGWEHIRHMAELGDYSSANFRSAEFVGVWKCVHRTTRQREETAYLYLSTDGRVAILGTFRP